jgi:hypothetical protein
MPHKSQPSCLVANSRRLEVQKILEENKTLVELLNSSTVQETNKVLRYLVETIERIETDLVELQAKVEPHLKNREQDASWRILLPSGAGE